MLDLLSVGIVEEDGGGVIVGIRVPQVAVRSRVLFHISSHPIY